MSLAIQNFKFLLSLFPLALLAAWRIRSTTTFSRLDKINDSHCSLWHKAKSGIGISIGFLAVIFLWDCLK